MSLRTLVENATASFGKGLDYFLEKRPVIDTTPVESTIELARPISSLDDIRRMMDQIARETAEAGTESFEEFYDFGEDSDFEDIPAPAQMKHQAVQLARDRDFEGEVLKAKEEYREKLNGEARERLIADLKAKQAKEAAEED